MKNLTNWLCLACFILTFVACGPASEKGKWTESDKKHAKDKFTEAMKKQLTERGQPVDESVVNNIADCWINKLEVEFTDLNEANENTTKRSELSDACVREILMPTEEGTQATEEPAATDSTQTTQ
jgi:hypothetical protein